MEIKSKLGVQNELVIQVIGDFDFNHYESFLDGYRKFDRIFKKYIVDLSETKTVDSSALGMFLLLRDFAGGDTSEIFLINPNPLVREILEGAKLNKVFNII